MADGERAAFLANGRGRDYRAKRRGNESQCNAYGAVRRGLSPKKLTHRLERRDGERQVARELRVDRVGN